ncbi:hypothetical protein Curi_c14910 [Gottschalkia acidurici 9a]|uniref:Uncharacterized protein n=1 Tax=Gottschalkia acidurici (strain ATCC 7906 / DSM 604 / BCRC 14475 / CIP 104303 / KCTC 5404 / NCIMB 10678 / 9a) TaxID=1128398 RepID=K0B0R3_GOTA9|nr:hypothetical protein [Gottschalkia acidurici]AFS78500.1 hypothetical protein Curi_c14910 [Gottschalkia acidurici 9a]
MSYCSRNMNNHYDRRKEHDFDFECHCRKKKHERDFNCDDRRKEHDFDFECRCRRKKHERDFDCDDRRKDMILISNVVVEDVDNEKHVYFVKARTTGHFHQFIFTTLIQYPIS